MTKTNETRKIATTKDGWKFSDGNSAEYCIYCGSRENLREINTSTTAHGEEYEIVLHQFFICKHCGIYYHGLWINSIEKMIKQAIEQTALHMIERRYEKDLDERLAVKRHIRKRFGHEITESAQGKKEQTGKIKKLVTASAQNKKE